MDQVSSPLPNRKKRRVVSERFVTSVSSGYGRDSYPPSTRPIDTEPTGPGRKWTLAMAVPASLVRNATSPEMRSYLAGQVGRVAAVYHVDEIVVYNDQCKDDPKDQGRNDMLQMARILQYLECPQYLRKHFFPFHSDLQYVGLLNPLDAPHHLKHDERSIYREGVVLEHDSESKQSFVDVGLSWNATVEGRLELQSRVTVKFSDIDEMIGLAVPSCTPRVESGIYWGYDVRVAANFNQIFLQSPHEEGYDLTVGVGPQGSSRVSDGMSDSAGFQHALLVMSGNLKTLDQLLAQDDKLDVKEADDFFDAHVNVLPSASATGICSVAQVRSEETILIALSALRPHLAAAAALPAPSA